jgi:choline-sulfatase
VGCPTLAAAVALGIVATAPARDVQAATAPSQVVLLTLDTTRSDALGCYGGGGTPNLDALARTGLRYARALTPCPLTLPAHCSLMTGLDPPAHGVRDNGTGALPGDIPTLAAALAQRGYATGAFVGSKVLDRRFGLARGFEVYDDAMPAEILGEYGYPERRAEDVVTAALGWVATLPRGRPFFLWAHFYDAHSPYSPPGAWEGRSDRERYAGEVAHVDAEIGRLLGSLPGEPGDRLVAVVGDHGEMLGEHGERAHGFFLYRASLEVPLILHGPGVSPGQVVAEVVSTRRLASTLLSRVGKEDPAFGAPLPEDATSPGDTPPVYSETFLPATAHGWAALRAVSDQRHRYVQAPRPELYDVLADPGETRNLVAVLPEVARRLRAVLERLEEAEPLRHAAALEPDEDVTEMLQSLGYLSGATSRGLREGTLDPKDGIVLAREYEEAREWLNAGRRREARDRLADLVRRSPGNVPFLTAYAASLQATGDERAAVAALREAVEVNPGNDLLHRQLADAHLLAGDLDQARAEYDVALELNPRSSRAWLGLADIAHRQGDGVAERRILDRALAAGTRSALVLVRLGQIEVAAGQLPAAERHLEDATRLVPALASAWWVWGEVAEAEGRRELAADRFARALAHGADDPAALRHLGNLLLQLGREREARAYLDRAHALGAITPP